MSAGSPASGPGRHAALAAWLALFLACLLPLLAGRVVFPHDNARELGLETAVGGRDAAATGNRFFADMGSIFVPEMRVHLAGARSSWLATWNPHVELGRPAGQLAGLGKAFLPAHLASFVFADALVAASWLAALALALSGLFAFLLLRELGLAPLACWTGAVLVSLGFYPLFWLTFGVYLWSTCWTLGLLWGVLRCARRPGFGAFVWVAFTVHAALLSAYPQALVWSGPLVAGFALAALRRRAEGDATVVAGARQPLSGAALAERCDVGTPPSMSGPARPAVGLPEARPSTSAALTSGARVALGLALAALAGAASALPVWLDVALETARSSRGALEPSYFLASIPRADGAAGALVPLAQLVDAFLWGVPVDPAYPRPGFKGTCLTPAVAAMLLVSLAAWRRLWPLHALVAAALVMTVWPAAYLFAVEHLGLGVSRFPPLAGAFVPCVLLAAYGVDRVLAGEPRRRAPWAALVAALYAAAVLVAARDGAGHAAYAAGGALLALASLLFLATSRAWTWIAAVAGGVLLYAPRLALIRPAAGVARTSPAVEALRELTRDGSRYALVGARVRILPPNEEAWLGLKSIHTYNSLASRAYREWVTRISAGGMELGHQGDWEVLGDGEGSAGDGQGSAGGGDYGRQFRRIRPGPELVGPELSWSGVGVLVSKTPLDASAFEALGGDLYRPRRAPILEAQLERFESGAAQDVRIAGFLHDAPRLALERVADDADRLRFRTTPAERETLLFVSQQHHPHWRAFAGGRELATRCVNGFYQGALVPPGTQEVELRFLPHARWSWIPQAAFVACGIGALVRRMRRRSA